MMLERWRKRLPKEKTREELDLFYEEEKLDLEKGDRLAMFLAALITFLPLILIGANDLVYGFLMFLTRGLLRNHLDFIYYLTSIILPELVYTVAVGLVLYQVLLRLNSLLERYEEGSVDIV